MVFEYHVSPFGDDAASGDVSHPLKTISRAACIAMPGDTITVHEGIYREQVDPKRGGTCEYDRIVYRAAPGERKPVITGSELISDWHAEPGHPHVWSTTVDGALFGDFNPFGRSIFGDWLESPKRGEEPDKHLGDVYLNGRSLYEATALKDVYSPPERRTDTDYALKIPCAILDPDQTRYVWYAEVDGQTGATTIWANFQNMDPNHELVEISVRRACFFPSRNHVDYITVRGFEMRQATGDWAPPTSAQWGMLGPNWSYGWIIEDNVLHDAKFSAISLGKEISTGDNEWSRTERKTGYQYQLEAVFKARRNGWNKGVVGSHLVRNNTIYDCGQNGIVGHMGCAFSRIEHNEVGRIGLKREFFGWEVAGIKFHAALDAVIEHNNIHDCSLGMWMDWQTQGTRITRNIFHRNIRDLMIEVSHGPYMVDNNVFASPVMFQNWSQGGAFVNNLICGSIEPHIVLDRSTPYHYPHVTDVAGCAVVSGGDERYLNNLFAPQSEAAAVGEYGLASYAQYPCSMAEYLQRQHDMWADPSQGGGERNPLQPVHTGGNIYLAGASGPDEDVEKSCRCEADGMFFAGVPVCDKTFDESMQVSIIEAADGLYLDCDVPRCVVFSDVPVVTSDVLGVPRIVEERYEQADGALYRLDRDINDVACGTRRRSGAVGELKAGNNHIRIWEYNHE